MASLKKKYQGKVKFYFVEYNQSEAQEVITKYKIEKHPTTIFLDENDNIVHTIVGFNSDRTKEIKDEIKELIR